MCLAFAALYAFFCGATTRLFFKGLRVLKALRDLSALKAPITPIYSRVTFLLPVPFVNRQPTNSQ